MTRIGLLLVWPWLLGLGFSPAGQPNTTATLLVDHDVMRPGDRARVGILLEMREGWHTYWINPGESGGPTVAQWKLPQGITVGDFQWPVPELYSVAGIGTYVYYDKVLILAPLSVDASVAPGVYELQAQVDWLECADICLPAGASVVARLEVGPSARPSAAASQFEAWQARVPVREPPPGLRAGWDGPGEGNQRSLWVEWQTQGASKQPDFFGFQGQGYDVSPHTERLSAPDQLARVRTRVTRYSDAWPERIPGVLIEQLEPSPLAWEVTLVPAELDAGFAPAIPSADPAADPSVGRPSVVLMLWFAFVGGLILNLMPCVLPVIALKVLGFLNQVKQSPAEVRRHGLIYGGGVLVSFLAMAALVLVVQAGGRAASWGMQFQDPLFLLIMTTLVALVALNLFGVFEVTLGGRAMGAAAQLASRSGPAGSFFHGMLATALATPCTAPFLGLALGFAFAQPPLIVLAMFLMVGFGLAFPYVLISFVPGLARWLPRPGPWMEKFKVAMGFPMAATAFWLLSLMARHYGTEGVLWVGVYLVFLALALWVWGEFVQQGNRRKPLAVAVSIGLLAVGYGVALERQLQWRAPQSQASAGPVRSTPGGIAWESWSAGNVRAAQADGRPVLVDFTADWCMTCKVNKNTSLEIPSVREKLREINAVALSGDYTLRDPEITQELRRWQRAGVPLVLVYSANPDVPPRVLPELLTPGLVLEALEWATQI
jgi:thiol:disulfide interchange protein